MNKNTMLKKPAYNTGYQFTNTCRQEMLCRPFRTQQFMVPLPVADATGYTTVPLQGTKLVETTGR